MLKLLKSMEVKSQKQIKYLLRITDKIGLIEHCVGSNPDYKEGWCVDDNARGLQVALRYNLDFKITNIYFDFLKKAWRNGKLYNDLNDDLTWKEDFLVNGEHIGRALFALGEAIKNGYKAKEAKELFDNIYDLIKKNKTEYLRVTAQTILGLQFYKSKEIVFWADKLVEKYKKENDKNWYWFEDEISYDNGRMPMALLAAYKITKNKKYFDIAVESLDFLTSKIFDDKNNYFSFPGYNGWFKKDGFMAKFGQQPIEAGEMVEVYCLAYGITKNKKYIELAEKSFEWYLGKNILGLKMINEETGGIFDGLNENGTVNPNQGAESVLSYLIAAKELNDIK